MDTARLWSLLLLILSTIVGVDSVRLSKYELHRCGVCMGMADEMWEKKNKLVSKERQPVKLSHRLGKGKWDHHGSGGVKKLDYETSELMAIEVVEGFCDGLPSDYKLRDDPDSGMRIISKNTTLTKSETYNKHEKDTFDSKIVSSTCHEFIDEYDEEVHNLVRQKFDDIKDFGDSLCKKLFKSCTKLDSAIKKEKSSKKAWEKRRSEKWEKIRSEGTPSSIQVSEFHFANDGIELDLTTITFSTESESGDHPATEGPEKAVDNNPNTKWLDHQKRGFVIKFKELTSIDAFSFTTANDNPERDPVRWVIEAHSNVETTQSEPQSDENKETEATTTTTEDTPIEEATEPVPVPEPEWVPLLNQTTVVSVTHDRMVRIPWQNFTSEVTTPYLVYRIRPLLGKNMKKVKKLKKVKPTKDNSDKSRFSNQKDEL